MSVCVCLSDGMYVSGTMHLNLTKLSVHVPCGHGMILFSRRCNILCTSGFVNDVTLSFNGPYGNVTLLQQPCCSVVHGLTPHPVLGNSSCQD